MATATLHFSTINTSLQEGDNVFYTTPTTNGAYTTADSFGTKWLGKVQSITPPPSGGNYAVVVDIQATNHPVANPADTDYFFFQKDKGVNQSGVLGYYAEVKIENTSTVKSELFSIAAEISESSK